MCVSIVASPAMRGSTPLDVAASSVMDNNGLALALEEPDLDKVTLPAIFGEFYFLYRKSQLKLRDPPMCLFYIGRIYSN